MKPRLDTAKIAKGLGAEPRGKVSAGGGYFGALQVAEEVRTRFRVPVGGGRATDPSWTERRLLPLRPETLVRLENLSVALRKQSEIGVEPMQLAAVLLERSLEKMTAEDAEQLLEDHHPEP